MKTLWTIAALLFVLNVAGSLFTTLSPTRLAAPPVAFPHTHPADGPGVYHTGPYLVRPCRDCLLTHRLGACQTNWVSNEYRK